MLKSASRAVEVPLIDLQAQLRTIRGAVDEAIRWVVDSQRFVLGQPVEELEDRIAELTGAKHAIGCASGTDALLLPLRLFAMDKGGGDVIVPAFTFFATAGAVHNAGLKPVFCDVSEETFNVTADLLADAWTDRTTGVVPVHLFGQMAPMDEILALAGSRDAWVLEDAAQAIGATQDRTGPTGAGSVGTAGTFSFFPTKNLGAFGDAGLITTNDEGLAARLKEYRVHGGLQMYHHDVVGTNSRIDALQAAVLVAKLPFLQGWSRARYENAQRYIEAFSDIPEVGLPTTLPGNAHIYNQFTVRVQDRDGLRRHLSEHGIGSGVYYPVPLHLQPCFKDLGYREGDFPVSERLSRTVLSLPIYPELTEEQIEAVINRVREFHGRA